MARSGLAVLGTSLALRLSTSRVLPREGGYLPCCPGLREVFQQKAGTDGSGAVVCDQPPLRVYACVQGRCGDGICEDAEAVTCGCEADCSSAAP